MMAGHFRTPIGAEARGKRRALKRELARLYAAVDHGGMAHVATWGGIPGRAH